MSECSKAMIVLSAVLLYAPFSVQAFQQNSLLANLPDNTARDLGDYAPQCEAATSSDFTNDCRDISAYSRFSYDSDRHHLLWFGGGHASTMRDDVGNFNFAALTWASDYTSTSCSQMTSVSSDGTWSSSGHPVARHTYDQLIYAPSVKKLFITSGVYGAGHCGSFGGCGEWCAGKILAYDPDAKTWSATKTTANNSHVWSSEYDPISGRIISAGGGGLLVYDPVADVQTNPVQTSPITGYADNMVYFPPTDKFYYIARGTPTQLYEITLNRTNWSASTISLVTGVSGAPGSQESGWAYDTANHIIGGGIFDGKFYSYDPRVKTWTTKTMAAVAGTPSSVRDHNLDYDPVDKVFIYYSAEYHTWAYCYSRNSATAIRTCDKIEQPRIKVTARTGQSDIRFRIETQKPIANVKVALFNAAGESLRFSQNVNNDNFVVQTDQHLRGGLYLLKIFIGKSVFTTKLVIQQ